MFETVRITRRFVAAIVIYVVAFAAVMGVSLWGLMSARDSLKSVHDDAMKPALLADESINKIIQNRLQILTDRKFNHIRASIARVLGLRKPLDCLA